MKLSAKINTEEFIRNYKESDFGLALSDLKNWTKSFPEGTVSGTNSPVFLNDKEFGQLQPNGSVAVNIENFHLDI